MTLLEQLKRDFPGWTVIAFSGKNKTASIQRGTAKRIVDYINGSWRSVSG